MSIDWLLTRLGATKSQDDVTQHAVEDVNNRKKVNNSQLKKAGKHARKAKVPDRPASGHSHCNPKKS